MHGILESKEGAHIPFGKLLVGRGRRGNLIIRNKMLVSIKLLHTLIWVIFVSILFYILFAALIGKIDIYLWISISLICLEGIVLIMNKGRCPLTLVAARYSQNQEDGFDIYLPKWLAIYNKEIFTTLFIVEMVILVVRLLA